jgi:hypothetical protein
MTENYYDILFISRNASPTEIKAAYRRLVLIYHPDRNIDGEKHFQKIRIAYETLINPDKRRQYDYFLISGKNVQRDSYNVLLSKKAFRSFKILLNKRVISVNELIEVDIITRLNGNNFSLNGLEYFKIVSSPEVSTTIIDNKRFFRLQCRLKPVKTGYLSLGPASIIVNNVKFESDKIFIKVKEQNELSFNKGFTKIENIIYGMTISAFFFLIGIMIYNINTRGLMPDIFIHDDNLQTKRKFEIYNQLNTGESPYPEYFDDNIINKSSENIIRFKNGNDYDAIVFIENEKGKTIKHNYIKAGAIYEMKYLPDGNYFLKVMFGNDWNKNKNLNNNIQGVFNKDLHFVVFSDSSEIIKLRHRKVGDSLKPGIYEIHLYQMADGNVKGKDSEKHEFFNNQ